jgi:hypothetical protein
MYSRILFKPKNTNPQIDSSMLELFFKSWIDNECNNEVEYKIERNNIFQVDFNCAEDATALKLKGIPIEFDKYLEIIN